MGTARTTVFEAVGPRPSIVWRVRNCMAPQRDDHEQPRALDRVELTQAEDHRLFPLRGQANRRRSVQAIRFIVAIDQFL